MSQLKTTSSISPSILALVAQGKVVGVGLKGERVGVLEVKERECKREKSVILINVRGECLSE